MNRFLERAVLRTLFPVGDDGLVDFFTTIRLCENCARANHQYARVDGCQCCSAHQLVEQPDDDERGQ